MATKKRWVITDEIAIADALKCKTRTEFSEKYSGSWRRLSNKGFKHLDEACSHMSEGYTQWSTEKCVNAARTCKTRKEFKRKHTGAYCHMSENKLHDLCYAHMDAPLPRGRQPSAKKLIQDNCSHDWVLKGGHRWGTLYKCPKCKMGRITKEEPPKLVSPLTAYIMKRISDKSK